MALACSLLVPCDLRPDCQARLLTCFHPCSMRFWGVPFVLAILKTQALRARMARTRNAESHTGDE